MEANQLSAKDFRLGNLINPDNPIMVEAWMLLPESTIVFTGIPLSEDVLLKLGFEKKSWKSKGIVIECFYYEKKGVIVYLIAKGFEIEVKHNEDQFNMFRVWNYVHQLQNLFYLLTGEELTFKN